MPRLSDDAYHKLDPFVLTVLERVRTGACSVDDGHLDVMHTHTALDAGNLQEVYRG
ncbi:hypothetical protein [Polymorphobacter megasporae]|uniref:hypothetical protein n=1 Tax=Glacieibacterium megasporae TaxID=2835787 RepID=UPI001C1DE40D|nr:hypothetical protein [Polymorphobacter megasporae]UAJ11052.1 hypothetical protein KTC28_04890 [Polymorphobacter megasporae]